MSDVEARPAPLTPPDCDLRDFPFMPLHVGRLRSSEQNSDCTPEQNWAALLLWAASWHEVPAGSIPDNEQWIAKACDYVSRGTVAPEWGTVREGAMRKFVKCSDGRLYHPTVCEQALIGWTAKLKQRWGSECGRIKKHNQRHGTDVAAPSYEAWDASGRPTGQALPEPFRPDSVPGDMHSKGQGEGQRQGQGQGDSKKNPAGSSEPRKRGSRKCPPSFEVAADLIEWAAVEAPLVDWQAETAMLRDHQFRDAHTDWAAVWRNWMRRANTAVAEKRRPGRSGIGINRQEALEQRNRQVAQNWANTTQETVDAEV